MKTIPAVLLATTLLVGACDSGDQTTEQPMDAATQLADQARELREFVDRTVALVDFEESEVEDDPAVLCGGMGLVSPDDPRTSQALHTRIVRGIPADQMADLADRIAALWGTEPVDEATVVHDRDGLSVTASVNLDQRSLGLLGATECFDVEPDAP